MAEPKGFGASHPALAGLLMIALGIVLLVQPDASLKTVIYLFGIMIVVYGLARIVAGLRGRMESKSAGVVGGLLAIIAGVAIMAWPEMSAVTLIYIIGGWAIATGVMDAIDAFTTGASAARKLWSVVMALVSVVFGVVLFINPGKGGLALLWLIGVYLIVYGILRIIVGVVAPMGGQLERGLTKGPGQS
jgi:uncharacterized membrane protein HdeD (DUF308 family)